MKDQVSKLPAGIPAAMLSSSQPAAESMRILNDLKVRTCIVNVKAASEKKWIGSTEITEVTGF